MTDWKPYDQPCPGCQQPTLRLSTFKLVGEEMRKTYICVNCGQVWEAMPVKADEATADAIRELALQDLRDENRRNSPDTFDFNGPEP